MTDMTYDIEQDVVTESKRISAIFSEVLDIGQVAETDNFFNLGGDSFDAIRVMSRLDGNLPIVALFEHPTAETLARFRLAKESVAITRLVPLFDQTKTNGPIVVICVPYGGGDPTAYRGLFNEHPDVRVFGVDFGDAEIHSPSDFSGLINTLINEIEAIDAEQIIVYGHCAGAATAACLASAITLTTSAVSLVVAASNPVDDPDAAIHEAAMTSDTDWGQYLRSLGAFNGLTDKETDAMLAKGRRDHFIATEAYRRLARQPARGIPAMLLLGDQDPATVQVEEIVNKWRKIIDLVESANVTGGEHYFIRTHAQEVASKVLSFQLKHK
jgi:surfactin synthase thioesterase subunit